MRQQTIAHITHVQHGADGYVTVSWVDTAGNTGTTRGEPQNTHMQALVARAEREKLADIRDKVREQHRNNPTTWE